MTTPFEGAVMVTLPIGIAILSLLLMSRAVESIFVEFTVVIPGGP